MHTYMHIHTYIHTCKWQKQNACSDRCIRNKINKNGSFLVLQNQRKRSAIRQFTWTPSGIQSVQCTVAKPSRCKTRRKWNAQKHTHNRSKTTRNSGNLGVIRAIVDLKSDGRMAKQQQKQSAQNPTNTAHKLPKTQHVSPIQFVKTLKTKPQSRGFKDSVSPSMSRISRMLSICDWKTEALLWNNPLLPRTMCYSYCTFTLSKLSQGACSKAKESSAPRSSWRPRSLQLPTHRALQLGLGLSL